jgi:hypothetical protein
MRTGGRSTFGLCLLAWGMFVSPPAFGFCRTTTCPSCPFDPDTGCPTGGRPIFWPRSCVSFSLNMAASSQVDLATATQYAHEAFATWNAVRCGSEGTPAAIQAQDAFGPVDCGHVEYNPTGSNANVILFRDGEWPYEGAGNTLALTTVTYDSKTGEIFDADMEINGTLRFSTPGVKGGVDDHDLLSIMTHEAGHFLGLAHSRQSDAIMQISLPPGVVRTTLSDDDIAGLCAIYPQASAEVACDLRPEGGFSTQCGLDPVSGGACAVRGDAGGAAAPLAVVVPVAAVLPWVRRRRRRRARVDA